MPSAAATKAKPKSIPTAIEITSGEPNPTTAYVDVGGTVQFHNSDRSDYRIRLWTKKGQQHAVIDVLISAGGDVTLMTDPDAKKQDDCEFNILSTSLRHPVGDKAASGGGGKIIIGPTPSPHRAGR
jgi:hypothetical protein